jgi:hypothetical protein
MNGNGIDLSGDIPAYEPVFDAPAYDGAGDPASMGGVPTVMPSNDWWKSATDLAGRALNTYQAIQVSKNKTGIAAPAGRISSSPMNPPPGSGGLFFQNRATPGADAAATGAGMSPQGMWLLAGIAVVVVVVFMLARR